MTLDEAKKMEGVEFTYIFEDGDTVPAYVKKFDHEKGLTCLSLATATEGGWAPTSKRVLEDDGTFCVHSGENIERCLQVLDCINKTGTFTGLDDGIFSYFGGCVLK